MQNSTCSDVTVGAVIKFLCDHLRVGRLKAKVTVDTEIGNDLGVDGDDGEELVEQFCRHFDIPIEEFNREFAGKRFFGPEAGWNPLFRLIDRVLRRPPLDILRVSDLVRCVERYGRVPESAPELP